jgi:hypothetical protein
MVWRSAKAEQKIARKSGSACITKEGGFPGMIRPAITAATVRPIARATAFAQATKIR